MDLRPAGFRAVIRDRRHPDVVLHLVRALDLIDDTGQVARTFYAFGPPSLLVAGRLHLDPHPADVEVLIAALPCPCRCGRHVYAPPWPLRQTVN